MNEVIALDPGTETRFALRELVVFRITQQTVRNGVAKLHGVIDASNAHADGTPRYDVLVPLTNELWQNVHPSHLIKDPIA